jgi:hypothetical protein
MATTGIQPATLAAVAQLNFCVPTSLVNKNDLDLKIT